MDSDSPENKPFECQYCGRGFNIEAARDRHEGIHESGYWDGEGPL